MKIRMLENVTYPGPRQLLKGEVYDDLDAEWCERYAVSKLAEAVEDEPEPEPESRRRKKPAPEPEPEEK